MTEQPPLAASGWSSSLSVAEHTAVREAGFTPLGLVMGSSVYQLAPVYSPGMVAAGGTWAGGGAWAGAPRGAYGAPAGGPWQGAGGWRGSWPGWIKYYSWSDLGLGGGWAAGAGGGMFGAPGMPGGWGPTAAAVCWERWTYEEGVEEAARLALERLEAETRALGGHGVIGIRLRFHYLEGLPSTIEFTALGTAVRREGAGELARPFTSHLDGQALLKLIQAGMVPVAAAVGVGSVQAEFPRWSMSGSSMELRPFGDAVERSRQLASERLVRASRSWGWAVLGTLASISTHGEGEGEVSNTVLTGTVVRRFASGRWDHLPLPVMRLSRR